jgi:hypothetical protein
LSWNDENTAPVFAATPTAKLKLLGAFPLFQIEFYSDGLWALGAKSGYIQAISQLLDQTIAIRLQRSCMHQNGNQKWTVQLKTS